MVVCVTNRNLCSEPFLVRIEKILKLKPDSIILREKDLTEQQYISLAKEVLPLCEKYNVPLFVNTFINTTYELGIKNIHFSMPLLRQYKDKLSDFNIIGVSVHSVEEGIEAENLGVNYITAGHIFKTDCKKNLEPRGLNFLKDICDNVKIPVYAIGGITPENINLVLSSGAKGVCIMSGLMSSENPEKYFKINK